MEVQKEFPHCKFCELGYVRRMRWSKVIYDLRHMGWICELEYMGMVCTWDG